MQDRNGFGGEFGDSRAGREALNVYGVLEATDWLSRVQNSTLTATQKHEVRETDYCALVSLADTGIRQDEGSRNPAFSLDLLKQAETFHEPTRAF